MRNKWGKGEPVNLSDLLKITPVANEILQLSEELDMSTADVLWIVSQIVDNNQEYDSRQIYREFEDEEISLDDEWDELDLEAAEEAIENAGYSVNVKISSSGRFPEIGFKAGVNDRDDINYFFEMILEMLDKLE